MDSLLTSMNEILKNYVTEVDVNMNKTIKYVAQDTVKMLKRTSPKESGDYARNWSVKGQRYMYNTNYVIFNKAPTYRLTHLLENGHDIVVNGEKVGRAPAQPHIAEAEAWMENELINRLADSI